MLSFSFIIIIIFCPSINAHSTSQLTHHRLLLPLRDISVNQQQSTKLFFHFSFSPKSAHMLINCRVMKRWASTVLSCLIRQLTGSHSALLFKLVKKSAVAFLTCIFALGGAIVGVITGAIKGQTTETGILRGVGVGGVTGAITGVQLMELIVNGEPFSKVALICSLVNGKIFMEWVSPAVLKAYQWQISSTETSLREISDIFEVNTIRGLSQDSINELPTFNFYSSDTSSFSDTSCAICLQDPKDGESVRLLPSCRHFFHLHCIDEWLSRQGSCPICRTDV